MYTRALSADEVAASYEAGPQGVSTDEVLAVLDEDQRKQLVALRETQKRLREEFQKNDPSGGDKANPWVKAFEDASTSKENALHAWVRYTAADASDARRRWHELVEFWRSEWRDREGPGDSQAFN